MINRSFSSSTQGHSIDFFGISFASLDGTTYNHVFATMKGFEIFIENLSFGFGFLRDADSFYGNYFIVSNLRNFLFPVLEVAITMGVFFFLFYMIIVLYTFIRIRSPYLKLIISLQFIPFVGTSKFFGLYATGELDINYGYSTLTDFTPIAVYSFLYIVILLLCENSFYNYKTAYFK